MRQSVTVIRFLLSLTFAIIAGELPAQPRTEATTLARIRAEGLERSQAQTLFLTLTDDIGARLTGSPSHVASARWAAELARHEQNC